MKIPPGISPTLERFLSRLGGLSRSGGGFVARCPAHDDQTASLSISEGKGGKVIAHCHAGCTFDEIVAGAGLEMKDTFPQRSSSMTRRPKIAATYDYTDEAGELLFQAVRLVPKKFRQRRHDPQHPKADGQGWVWKKALEGVRHVLYRLPRVLEASRQGGVVFVVEGRRTSTRWRTSAW